MALSRGERFSLRMEGSIPSLAPAHQGDTHYTEALSGTSLVSYG